MTLVSQPNTFCDRGYGPTGLNFDEVATPPGWYWVNKETASGTFPESQAWGMLVVFSEGSYQATQLFASTDGMWSRFNVNDAWSGWCRLS